VTARDDEPTVFDDAFVAAAPVREADPLPKPSRASVREVKREARARARGPAATLARPARPRRTGRLRQRLAVAGMAVAALAGAAFFVSRLPGPPRHHRAAPIVVPSYTPPPRTDDLFAGSKVAKWPVGAAGIKAPAATAVGAFSAAEVADAYARTAAYARAAMLDRSVLYGGATAPVFRTLEPAAARQWRTSPDYVMTRFDRRTVAAAADGVRVNGRMTASIVEGALRVDLTYVAVYALRPAAGPGTAGELVAIQRRGSLDFGRGRVRGQVGLPAYTYRAYTSDHRPCGVKDPSPGYVTVVFDATAPSATPSADPKEDFNVLDPTAKEPDGCFTDTSGLQER
jgi:hypothetical protein